MSKKWRKAKSQENPEVQRDQTEPQSVIGSQAGSRVAPAIPASDSSVVDVTGLANETAFDSSPAGSPPEAPKSRFHVSATSIFEMVIAAIIAAFILALLSPLMGNTFAIAVSLSVFILLYAVFSYKRFTRRKRLKYTGTALVAVWAIYLLVHLLAPIKTIADNPNVVQTAPASTKDEWIVDGDGSPLIPGSEGVPKIEITDDLKEQFKISDNDIFLVLGRAAYAWTHKFPHTLIAQGREKEPMIVIDKKDNGALINANIFDASGQLDCQVINNRLHFRKAKIFSRAQTEHELTIRDARGSDVFVVRYANPRTIYFDGDYYLRYGSRMRMTSMAVIGGKEVGTVVPKYGYRLLGDKEISVHVDPDVKR